MTFCIGIRVREGIVALADTQVVRGDEISSKAKLSLLAHPDPVVLMTSGLRSVRDKTVNRLEDRLAAQDADFPRMHQIASAFGDELKQVRLEDGPALESGGLRFNMHALMAGHLPGDDEPTLFQVYPEGNWIEATADAPYFVIGRSPYGKPILDRLLRYDTPLPQALALAYLAFDATRASVVDVEFPIDVVLLRQSGFQRYRFGARDLENTHAWWHERLRRSLDELPMDWAEPLLRSR